MLLRLLFAVTVVLMSSVSSFAQLADIGEMTPLQLEVLGEQLGIYLGPLPMDPAPDSNIKPWPNAPSTYPEIDCCQRLDKISWLQNQYDILDERIDMEYRLRQIYLNQAPLDDAELAIVLTFTLRIMKLEADLEDLYNEIVLQNQIYMVFCVDCVDCG